MEVGVDPGGFESYLQKNVYEGLLRGSWVTLRQLYQQAVTLKFFVWLQGGSTGQGACLSSPASFSPATADCCTTLGSSTILLVLGCSDLRGLLPPSLPHSLPSFLLSWVSGACLLLQGGRVSIWGTAAPTGVFKGVSVKRETSDSLGYSSEKLYQPVPEHMASVYESTGYIPKWHHNPKEKNERFFQHHFLFPEILKPGKRLMR